MFFVVGTLGPSIKLIAMQGVPWTKAWGAMFLFAFLVTEAAALFARRSSNPSVYSSLPGIHKSTAESLVAQRFEVLERWVFYAATAAHCSVLLWAYFDIWSLRLPAYASETIEPISMPSLILIFVGGNIAFAAPVLPLLSLFFVFKELRDDYLRGKKRKWHEWLVIIFAVVIFLLLLWGCCIPLMRMDFSHFQGLGALLP